MGILNKVRSIVSIYRDTILENNSKVFKPTSYNTFTFNDISTHISLKGANIELIEEPKNVIALGIPLTDIHISNFIKGNVVFNGSVVGIDTGSFSEKDVKGFIKNDYKSANKSESHIIIYRLKYEKNEVEDLWDSYASSVKKYRGINLYNIEELVSYDYTVMRGKKFPISKYLDIMIDKNKMFSYY